MNEMSQESNINVVMTHAGVDRNTAITVLNEAYGDIVNAVMSLTNNNDTNNNDTNKKFSINHILNIKVVSSNPEVLNWYTKKALETNENSGFDLIFPQNYVISTKKFKIDFEIQCQLACHEGCDGKHGYFLMSRSSIHDSNIRLSNNIGLIDYQYRGNIKAGVDNINDESINLETFSRLFQIVMPDARPFEVKIVDVLTTTERGEGGFGSTGK